MKNSELRKLVAKYKEIKNKLKTGQNNKLNEQLEEIEHRYFHEIGRSLKSDLKEIT